MSAEATVTIDIWKILSGTRVLTLRVWIDSDFCVYAADLPGCASHGKNIKECLVNIEEAFRGLVESYDTDSVLIPWQPNRERPLFHEERRIIVEFPLKMKEKTE